MKMQTRPLSSLMAAAALFLGLGACDQLSGPDSYTGYVEAEFVYVAAPDAGWIIKAPVREGDTVSPGDALFELDTDRQHAEVEQAAEQLKQAVAEADDIATGARYEEINALKAQLKEAEAALRLAVAERSRWTELVRRGVASRSRADQVVADHESAIARVRTARANISVAELPGRNAARDAAAAKREAAAAALAQARWRFDERSVESKVAGRVEEVFHRAGEYVTAGSPVLALLPPGAVKVRFFVPQDDLTRVTIGAAVQVHVDSATALQPARVTHIAREAEFTPPVIYSAESRQKLVFLVEAHLDNPGALRPGQPVDVGLP